MRPRIDKFWIDHIRVYVAEHRDWSGSRIREELKRVKNGPTSVPSDRAIRRVKEEFAELSAAEQVQYERFLWPESMENGALPWESSQTVLDLLRRYRAAELPPPLIQECLWFWRVSLALPDLDIDARIQFAAQLVAIDASGRTRENLRSIENRIIEKNPTHGPPPVYSPRAGIYLMQRFLELSKQPAKKRRAQK